MQGLNYAPAGTFILPMACGKHALVVDDYAMTRTLLRRALERLDLRVTTAANGLEGLSCAAASPFDLVITDVQMPSMNGLQMLEALRARPGFATTPSVVVSASWSQTEMKYMMRVNASLWMLKPVDLTLFQRAVSKLLALPGAVSAAKAPMADADTDVQRPQDAGP